MTSRIKAIIPCCGFGTRMGMKPNESKEMLFHNGFPIIDYALDLCKQTGMEPVVIMRQEKADLGRHLEMNHGQVLRAHYQPTGELAQTILDNKNLWSYQNILLLPDVRFTPAAKTIIDIQNSFYLDRFATFAVHKVTDPQNWGILSRNSICEKPSSMIQGATYDAWGLIGFNKYNGVELFSKLLEKGKWHSIKPSTIIRLDSFEDVTRRKE